LILFIYVFLKGNSVVCGSGVLDLRDGGAEVISVRAEGVTALDACGDVVCMAVDSKLELWDCNNSGIYCIYFYFIFNVFFSKKKKGSRKMSFLEKDCVLSENNESISALRICSSFVYAATERGSLLWN
jgi:hypothetical protein